MNQKICLVLSVILLLGCFSGCGDPNSRGNVSTSSNGTVNGTNQTLPDEVTEEPLPDVPRTGEDLMDEFEEMIPENPMFPEEEGTGMSGDK